MSKSILVMDTPDRCWKCDACASWQESAFSDREYWCCVKDKDVDPNSKPDWCPLITAPKKNYDGFLNDWEKGYKAGYNACINEILGGK